MDMERKAMMKWEVVKRTDARVQEFQETKRKKIEMLKQDNKNKEMSECTFKPQTYSWPGYRRNLNEFLED